MDLKLREYIFEMFNYKIRQKKSIFSKLQTLTPPLNKVFVAKGYRPSTLPLREINRTKREARSRVACRFFDCSATWQPSSSTSGYREQFSVAKASVSKDGKMTSEITSRHVEKLDDTNFLTWKFEMSAVFDAAGVDDIVDGTRVLAADAAAAVRAAWKKDNVKAIVLISTSVQRAQLQPLVSCTTAKQMWDALCAIYEQKSTWNKLYLSRKFHEYRMASGDSMVQHVAKVKNMAQQLRVLGSAVDDTTVMAKILASLSPKYSAFRTVWENMDENRSIHKM